VGKGQKGFMCDVENERAFEERKERLQAIDMEKRGFCLCPTCGIETRRVIFCPCGCGMAGCPNCMVYDHEINEYFCSEHGC